MKLVPGDAIGIRSCTSISSALTQQILNQFHQCGTNIKTITKGVPRLLELMNLTQKPDIVAYNITFKHGVSTVYTPRDFQYKTLHNIFQAYEYEVHPHWAPVDVGTGILLKLNIDTICELKILPQMIRQTVHEDLQCKINANFELFIWGKPCDMIENIYLNDMFTMPICGIANIYHIEPTTDGICAYTQKSPQVYLEIYTHPLVNPHLTWANNIWQIYAMLGVEAARSFLYKEMREIMDSRLLTLHIELLINQMSWFGKLQSLSRYSLRDDIASVFTKASFEESMLNFLNAVFLGEEDPLTDVSSNIVVGQRTSVGTGFFHLIQK